MGPTGDRLVLSGRYELGRVLGEGGTGTVHAALDRHLSRPVAIKLIRSADPERVYRLKREFRSISQVVHPNLVQLHELFVHPELSFLVMEMVDGVDFYRYCRTETGDVSLPRLRNAARQLVLGVSAVHDARQLHRDLKPTNVLVERGGRVVVMDLGLATGLDSDVSLHARTGTFAGTPAYMAPEQVWGGKLSTSSDLYSIGVMLFEVLAGRLPYEPREILTNAPRVPTIPECIPDEWVGTVLGLLQPDPKDRPSTEELLHFLEADPAHRQIVKGLGFVGRDREQEELRRALERSRNGGCTIAEIAGVSGVGKTALVSEMATEFETLRGSMVLRSRCHPRESIPFNAIDGLVDDVVRILEGAREPVAESCLPEHSQALRALFPVLGRLPVFSASSELTVPAQPQETRSRAIVALREVLATLAEGATVVLWVDDFQWADLDSVTLLDELCREPNAPRMLLLLTYRTGEHVPSRALERWASLPRADVIRLPIGPLADDDVRRIIESDVGPDSAASVDQAIAESLGNPLLAREFARSASHLAASAASAAPPGRLFYEVIARRCAGLSRPVRDVLELVALAGSPLVESVVQVALARGEDVRRSALMLERESLLRVIPGESGVAQLEPMHDRIREAVVHQIPDDRKRYFHRVLVDALETVEVCDPGLAVHHALLGGDEERAGRLAFQSAERAMSALAFHRAAGLYRRAVELGTDEMPSWAVRERLAHALSNAGLVGEAGDVTLSAARELAASGQAGADARRLFRDAASHLMRSGRFSEGVLVLRDALRAQGLWYPRQPWQAVTAIVVNRTRIGIARRRGGASRPADETTREKLEAYWLAGAGHSMFDSTRGADFQARHALLAQRVGDPAHLARALATEALLRTWEGGAAGRRAGTELHAEARRLSRIAADPRIDAHRLLMEAGSALLERHLRHAVLLCDEGEALCRSACQGVAWELAGFQHTGLAALAALGDVERLNQRSSELLREADDRGDVYARLMLRVGTLNLGLLASGRADEALRESEAALSLCADGSTISVYQGLYGLALIELYLGRPGDALRRIEGRWKQLRGSQALRLQSVRIEMLDLRARAEIAAALETPAASRRELLARAERTARSLKGEDAPWARPVVDSLHAALATCRGDRASAERLLERSAIDYERSEMSLHAASARHQLGVFLGGGGGASLRDEAARSMLARGVVDPARLASTWIPIAL